MLRKTPFAIGEYYHCYVRGNDKRKIFITKKDYLRFCVLLYVCNSNVPIHVSNFEAKTLIDLFDIKRGDPLVAIGSYCLMPNHFHILLKEIKKDGISIFMQKLNTAYTMYFNKKNDRRGSLFEGCFKSQYVDSDKYFKYLFSYINLNPVKLIDPTWKENGIKNIKVTKNFLKNYEYSSYVDFLGEYRPQSKILSKSEFPEYFRDRNDFSNEINDWLLFSRQGETLL